MIHAVRYICDTTGYERCSNNVTFKTVIEDSLEIVNSNDCKGSIVVTVYLNVKCMCGQTHVFLVDAENKTISI